MTHIARSVLICAAAAAAVVASQYVSADDAVSLAKYNDAKAHFSHRENPAEVDAALAIVNEALPGATDDDIKFDLWILKSHIEFWKGAHLTDSKEMIAQFEEGMKSAAAARAVNEDYAESYYMHGLNLARWGKTVGKLKAAFRLTELKTSFSDAQARSDRNGNPGERIDSYGPDRILGKVYFELPWPMGDNKKSLKHLEKAFNGDPTRVLNVVYYAETLAETGSKDKAIQLLDEILKKDPASLNPDKIQENTEELVQAQELRNKL